MALWLKQQNTKKNLSVIIGRDARISGDIISSLVSNTLIGLGINVVDLGLSTTPTVEIAVSLEGAHRRHYYYGKPQSQTMECIKVIEQ